MIESTGNAQKVWDLLRKAVADIPVQELCKRLALTFEEVMTAIRIIAREHNIGLANNNGCLMVIGIDAN